jgi:hypothetical protein
VISKTDLSGIKTKNVIVKNRSLEPGQQIGVVRNNFDAYLEEEI